MSPSTAARSATTSGSHRPTPSPAGTRARSSWHRRRGSPFTASRRTAYVAAALDDAAGREPDFFETHIARVEDGIAALWQGDAGYDTQDPAAPGPRHRLLMVESGWRYERD